MIEVDLKDGNRTVTGDFECRLWDEEPPSHVRDLPAPAA
jgi:hypothetical protein